MIAVAVEGYDLPSLRLVNTTFAQVGLLATWELTRRSDYTIYADLRVRLMQRSLDHFFAIATHETLRHTVQTLHIEIREFDLFDVAEDVFERAARPYTQKSTELDGRNISSDVPVRASYSEFRSAYVAQHRLLEFLRTAGMSRLVDAYARLDMLRTLDLKSVGSARSARVTDNDTNVRLWNPRFAFLEAFTIALEGAGRCLHGLSIAFPPRPSDETMWPALSLGCPLVMQNLVKLTMESPWSYWFEVGSNHCDFTTFTSVLGDAINLRSLSIDGSDRAWDADKLRSGLLTLRFPHLEELKLLFLIVPSSCVKTFVTTHAAKLRRLTLSYVDLTDSSEWRGLLKNLKQALHWETCTISHQVGIEEWKDIAELISEWGDEWNGVADIGGYVLGSKKYYDLAEREL